MLFAFSTFFAVDDFSNLLPLVTSVKLFKRNQMCKEYGLIKHKFKQNSIE